MKVISVLLKPASSACNMRCQYCFYADVSSKRAAPCLPTMSLETLQTILTRLRSFLSSGDSVSFLFQGGEPTLVGLEFYKRFFELTAPWEKSLHVSYAVQTNGLLLDERWCALFKRPNLLMGLSLDLPRAAHDEARIDAAGKGTYSRVVQAMRLLRRASIPFNVLCTLTKEVAARPRAVWQSICDLDIPYIQFTPCLGALNDETPSPYALTPALFAAFYKDIFALWAADLQKGKPRSVKLFDDIIDLLMTGRTSACGLDGKCRTQLVVEADGSVYPCDFFCTDEFFSGSLLTDAPDALLEALPMKERLHLPQALLCERCPYRPLCGGGCPRMRREMYMQNDAYCGYADFLQFALPTLNNIATMLRHTYTQ